MGLELLFGPVRQCKSSRADGDNVPLSALVFQQPGFFLLRQLVPVIELGQAAAVTDEWEQGAYQELEGILRLMV